MVVISHELRADPKLRKLSVMKLEIKQRQDFLEHGIAGVCLSTKTKVLNIWRDFLFLSLQKSRVNIQMHRKKSNDK